MHNENISLIQSIFNEKILSWSYIDEGYDNMVYEINNEWIFKLPRRIEVVDMLKREHEFLNFFSKISPIDIPVFEFFTEKAVGYQKIEGKNLDFDLIQNADESIQRQALIDMTDFLNVLHNCNFTSIYESSYRSFFSIEEFNLLADEVRKNVIPNLSLKTQASVNSFLEEVIKRKSNFHIKRGIIHGDLTSDNIIWNEELQKISGIIDFGDVSKNAVLNDLISIGNFCYPESDDFLIHLLSNYNTEDPGFFRKIKLFSFVEKLSWAVQCLEILKVESNKTKDALKAIENLFSDQKAFEFI